jgi:hypothetical protein
VKDSWYLFDDDKVEEAVDPTLQPVFRARKEGDQVKHCLNPLLLIYQVRKKEIATTVAQTSNIAEGAPRRAEKAPITLPLVSENLLPW